ncbi:copper homeostasis protein CutC [Croceitalea sp. MTPC5]|uniref:copper homeostasis protein CutC n=1 Tax=Croceitalea sp. MTPC5 TaxID=3056565 RepID=UPI002B37A969|nr:copper homeostasis protein CutC [Croceitalea sp. MTPC5]
MGFLTKDNNMLIEVCCNSLESAINAERAGADRIELCVALGVGGVTPSHGLIQLVKQEVSIPIHVLIRPRSGHFVYSETEFEVMLNDIRFCREMGVEGIVSGILNRDHTLDMERMKIMIGQTGSLHFTFHRAFDWIADPETSLLQLEDMGVNTILTSGQQATASQGITMLKRLKAKSTKTTIMPGGGIRIENIVDFMKADFKVIHFSGTTFTNTVDIEHKISMNSQKHLVESQVAVTNEQTVRQLVRFVK